MKGDSKPKRVIIVGGGFAGLGLARSLAGHPELRVTLIDRNNYHQFQPLLYQVATSLLAPGDVAYSLRKSLIGCSNVDVKLGEVVSVDPAAKTVTTSDGEVYAGDYLVLAAGSRPHFFNTPGADQHSFPLYSLDDAQRLRSRILQVFEDADRDVSLLDEGALNFVIVGGGPTGVETAGALADLINETMKAEYPGLAAGTARIHLVDHGKTLLGPFSEKAHEYAARILREAGVNLRLTTGVQEVGSGHVLLSDGTTIKTRVVVWGGGLRAAALAEHTSLVQGKGGRIDVLPDLTAEGHPCVYVLGDFANVPGADGRALPQLGSVALQTGQWTARNILLDLQGKSRLPFQYHDKGIMAMIRRDAAIAEVGESRHELHGMMAYAAWLGVHAALLSGIRPRIEAFMQWAWDHFARTSRGPQVLDRSDAARIDWEEDEDEGSGPGKPPEDRPTSALWVRPGVANLVHTATEQFVRLAARAIRRRGRFDVVLAGGPRHEALYGLLAQEPYLRRVDWKRVHVYWNDPNSTDGTARESFVKAVAVPGENVHRLASGEGENKPPESGFDLILLEMGDGWPAALPAGIPPAVLESAKNVTVLVTGADNAERLRQVLEGPDQGGQAMQPTHGGLRWIVEESAASRLTSKASRFLSPAGSEPVPKPAGLTPSARHPGAYILLSIILALLLLASVAHILWGIPSRQEETAAEHKGTDLLEKTPLAPSPAANVPARAAAPVREPHPPVKVDAPTAAQAAFNKGAEAHRKGDHATAVRHYTEAIEKAPTPDVKALHNRALAHLASGAPDDAIRDLTSLLAIDSRNAAAQLDREQAYFRRGLSYLAKKQYPAAVQDFTRVLVSNPRNADAHYNRGLAHLELKEYDPAVADFDRVLELAPGEKVYYERGLARRHQGQYKAAIQDFTQAIQMAPKDADAYYERGVAYLRARDNDAAIADFTEAIRLETKKPAYDERGCAHLRKRENRAAEKDFTAAIARDANDDVAYYNRGLARFRLKEDDGAIADFTKAIELNPKDAALSYWFRSQAQRRKGNTEAAAADRATALKLDPNVEK